MSQTNIKRLEEIKKEMLDLIAEADDILEGFYDSKPIEYKMSKLWIAIIQARITGDDVISSLAYDIEYIKEDN